MHLPPGRFLRGASATPPAGTCARTIRPAASDVARPPRPPCRQQRMKPSELSSCYLLWNPPQTVTNAATSSSSATKAAMMIGVKATAMTAVSFVAAVGQAISTRGYLHWSATFWNGRRGRHARWADSDRVDGPCHCINHNIQKQMDRYTFTIISRS